jgi:hypothetical protein
MEKMQPGRSRSDFSLLHIDLDLVLEKKYPNDEKERRMRIRGRVAISCGALLQQIQGQNFSP